MNDMEKLDDVVGAAIALQMEGDDNDDTSLGKAARIALLSHIESEGWRLVPKVATNNMEAKARHLDWTSQAEAEWHQYWAVMVAAAPKFGGNHE